MNSKEIKYMSANTMVTKPKEAVTLHSKQISRQEAKRKKLVALINVSKLNIKEKLNNDTNNMSLNSSNSDEPCIKKAKKHKESCVINEKCQNQCSKIEVVENSYSNINSLKAEYNTLKKIRSPVPKLQFRTCAFNASLSIAPDERVPLMLTDIQHLLLHAVLGNSSPYNPSRWYVLTKYQHICQTTCLVVEGVSIQHWINNKADFTSTPVIFSDIFEILTPSVYNGSLVEELAAVPLSEADKEVLEMKYGTMDLALETRKDLMTMIQAVFPVINDEVCKTNVNDHGDKFSRTQLILSASQLIEENYPVPLKGKLKNIYAGYVMTQDIYRPVTSNSPMFGLDCEMCITDAGSELTRISVVNEKHEIIYETYVKPYNSIVNYLTQFSGITKSDLEDVTKRLSDVQKDLRELMPPDAILVGQSLNVDLHAMKMMHPYVIDTSVIFNITGDRSRKSKLKVLAKEFLNENIQENKKGHCSVEDSLASLKLVQLKLNKSLDFGDAVLTGKMRLKLKVNNLDHAKTVQYASTIFNHMIEQKKTSIIVGCDDITGDYHSYMTRANECSNTQSFLKKGKAKKVKLSTVDKQNDVIESLSEVTTDHNFAMGHLKLDINNENTPQQLRQLDNWIETIWKSLSERAVFVVVFGGTSNDNGVAMIKIKNKP